MSRFVDLVETDRACQLGQCQGVSDPPTDSDFAFANAQAEGIARELMLTKVESDWMSGVQRRLGGLASAASLLPNQFAGYVGTVSSAYRQWAECTVDPLLYAADRELCREQETILRTALDDLYYLVAD